MFISMTSCVAPRLTCPSLSSKLSSSCKIEMLTVSSLKQLRLIKSFIRQPSCSQSFVKALGELKELATKKCSFSSASSFSLWSTCDALSPLLVLIYIHTAVYIYTYTCMYTLWTITETYWLIRERTRKITECLFLGACL